MPSMRRMRVFGVMILLFVVTVLWYTGSARQQRSPDFYRSTKTALDHDRTYKTHQVDDDAALAAEMADRLRSADAVAKDNANAKAPSPRPLAVEKDKLKPVVEDVPTDRNVAGRKKYPIEGEGEKVVQKTSEDHDVEVEINSILKRSPIIIFSKSYCPHSKRAKHILLDKYDISPAPYVVELDKHELGQLLQAKLATMTGRKTVPNVLVNGKSIGGGDEVAELDETKNLASKIQSMAGKQMQKILERPV